MTLEEKKAQLRLFQKREALKGMMAQQPVPEAPQYKNETPEWFSYKDRMAVKNLSNSPEESMKYLQGKYPDAEFTNNGDEIYMRKKGEKDYGRLDPEGMGDWLKDAGDLIYDVGQGALEAGGVALGATAGLGAGSIPAAVAGGAAGSAVASTAKEALRKQLGMTDEVSLGNIATDAAIGGAIPLGLGVAGKGLSVGAKKVAPWLYGKATGISPGALNKIADGAGDLSDTEALNVIKGARETVGDYIQNQRSEFGKAFAAKRGSGAKVDIEPTVASIDNMIAEAQREATRSESTFLAEKIKRLQDMKDRILSRTGTPDQKLNFDPATGHIDMVQPKTHYLKGQKDVGDVMNLKSRTSAEYLDFDNHLNNGFGSGNSISADERRGASEIVRSLDNAIYGDDLAGQELKREFGDSVKAAEYLDSKFYTDDKAQHTLRNLRKGKDRVLKGQVANTPKSVQAKLQDAIEQMEIADYFNNPEQGNYIKRQTDNLLGKTPLSKALQAGGALTGYLTGGGYAGSAIGGLAGRKVGDLLTSPEAVKAITRFAKEKGIATETAMKAIADDPKLMALIYGLANTGNR